MMRLPRPPGPPDIISENWFLCHRGVEPSVIAEIVAALTEKHQDVTVQDGDACRFHCGTFGLWCKGSWRVIVALLYC